MKTNVYFNLLIFLIFAFSCQIKTAKQKERDEYIYQHPNFINEFQKRFDLSSFPFQRNDSFTLSKFAVINDQAGWRIAYNIFTGINKEFTTLYIDSLESVVLITHRDTIFGKYDDDSNAMTELLTLHLYDLRRKIKFNEIDIMGYRTPEKIRHRKGEEVYGRGVMPGKILYWIQRYVNGKAIEKNLTFQ
jgi:hypothetical protein